MRHKGKSHFEFVSRAGNIALEGIYYRCACGCSKGVSDFVNHGNHLIRRLILGMHPREMYPLGKNSLCISPGFGIYCTHPWPFHLTASLLDGAGALISLVNSGPISLAAGNATIEVVIAAEDIVAHGQDGPYQLVNVELSDDATGLVVATIPDYQTAAYALTDFNPLDSDKDGLADVVESTLGTDPALADTDGDLDGDGLNNITEYNLHTLPNNIDSDEDGRNDFWEVNNATAPTVYEDYVRSAADFDLDGTVGPLDLAVLAEQWLGQPGASSADIAPEGGDGKVDLQDFAEVAREWLGS